MESSIFGTRLKIAMRNKDTYHNDNGKRKRTKRYTKSDLANEIGYTVDAISGWTKKKGTLPNPTKLKEIADILDVDTAYLLGEQICQRNANQTICNVTELNEQSAQVLTNLKDITADIMNELLNHTDFERLLLTIYEYTRSHNNIVTIKNTIDGSEYTPYSGDAQRQVMKYRASETFGKILDDIYKSHQNVMTQIKSYSILKKMIDTINSYLPVCQTDEEHMTKLLKIISIDQNQISELEPDSIICKFTPEQIIENFDKIKEIYS